MTLPLVFNPFQSQNDSKNTEQKELVVKTNDVVVIIIAADQYESVVTQKNLEDGYPFS